MSTHQLIASSDGSETAEPQGLGLLGLPDDVLARPRPSKVRAFARAALGLVQKFERDLKAEPPKPKPAAAALAAPARPAPAQVRAFTREKQPWELDIERHQNEKRADHLEGKIRAAANGKLKPEVLSFVVNVCRERALGGDHVGALVDADEMLATDGIPPLE